MPNSSIGRSLRDHCQVVARLRTSICTCALCALGLGQMLGAATSGDPSATIFSWISPEIIHYDAAASANIDWEGTVLLDDGSTYGRTVERAGVRTQPWSDAHNEIQLTGSVNQSITRTSAALTPDGEFPTHLYDLRAGGFYRHVESDGTIYGGNASIGSADSTPFSSTPGTTVAAALFYRLPTTGRNAWLFTLSYSNDRALFSNVPFPGVAYEWHPDPTFMAIFGIPLLYAVWHPTPQSDLDAATSILGYAHLGGWYKPFTAAQFLRVTAALDYSSEVYKWPGHLDTDQSVFFRGISATVGLNCKPTPQIGGGAYAGYAFDRAVLAGDSIVDYNYVLGLRPSFIFGVSGQLGF